MVDECDTTTSLAASFLLTLSEIPTRSYHSPPQTFSCDKKFRNGKASSSSIRKNKNAYNKSGRGRKRYQRNTKMYYGCPLPPPPALPKLKRWEIVAPRLRK